MASVDERAFPHLQAPFALRGRPLRNRLMHASIVTFLSDRGRLTQRLIDYHVSRARGGAALIVTEPVSMIARQDVPNWVRAWTPEAEDDLRRWAAAVEAEDTRLLAQLLDRGRGRNVPGRNDDAIGPSALPDDLSLTMPRALRGDEIAPLVEEFANSAARLERCGFSGVEISAGHGHLIHQFLSPRMNHREDAYGGDLDGRTRLLRELIAALRSRCGAAFIIAVKLPGDDGVRGSIDEDEARRIAARVTAGGDVDLVSFAQGSHSHTLERHVPDGHAPRTPYLQQLRRLRQAVEGAAVAALGRITDPAEAEGILARGEADLVALGRALIADPAWLRKAASGRSHAIRYCVSCNTCWERTTALRLPLGCDNNPRVAEADECDWMPARTRAARRVVVVGAGIAGLEAAWTAAARGHAVTLLGAGAEPGGKARLRAQLPGGEALSSVYDYQHAAALRAGVRFEFGVHAGIDEVLTLKPDSVVLAGGATMVPPLWLTPELAASGVVSDLRTAMADLIEHKRQHKRHHNRRDDRRDDHRHDQRAAGTAVVFDLDQTEGTYAAVELLHALFERVVVVTPLMSIARDTSLVTRQGIVRRFSERRIEVLTSSELLIGTDLDDGIVHALDLHTQSDTALGNLALLTYATPRAPDESLWLALSRAGVPTLRIGDYRNARGVYAATSEGHAAGMEL